jgi:hypothetical protein
MTRSISSICCVRWRRQSSPSRSSEWERRTISPERSPSWRRTTAATSAALAKCDKMHLGSPGIGEADGAPALDQRSYQTFRTVHRFRSRGLFASDPYRSTIVCRLRQSSSRHCCRAGRDDRPSWLGAVVEGQHLQRNSRKTCCINPARLCDRAMTYCGHSVIVRGANARSYGR